MLKNLHLNTLMESCFNNFHQVFLWILQILDTSIPLLYIITSTVQRFLIDEFKFKSVIFIYQFAYLHCHYGSNQTEISYPSSQYSIQNGGTYLPFTKGNTVP
jgi:hypothetical protein